RTALTLPNGSQATFTYDAASQLTSLLNQGLGVTPVTISRFDYTYDAVGNRITRTATNGIANYTYDALNRLTQATQPNPVDPLQQLTESFSYDPVGNRASSHLATGQLHDAANRLLEDSRFTFSYDGNGNLAEQVSKANGDRVVYTYSVDDQLIRVEKFTVAAGPVPILTAVYRYDAVGRRIEKNVDGVVTRYVYDQENILLELSVNNQPVASYTHGPTADEPLIMMREGQDFFYHADGLGSIWDLTDGVGTPVRSYVYDSFGQLLAQSGSLVSPYTYTGRELDPETGLYFYRARYYLPAIGRFIQTDLLFALNRYAYVANSPLNFADPQGLQRTPGLRPFPPTAGEDLTPPLPDLFLPFRPTRQHVEIAIRGRFGNIAVTLFQNALRKPLSRAREQVPPGMIMLGRANVIITRSPFKIEVPLISIPPDLPGIVRDSVPGQVAVHTFFLEVEGIDLPGQLCPLFPVLSPPFLKPLQ
ncbi:MAG: RHS repeat domain-containing protein, partial [Candidatus Binatia bacterium]